MEFAGALFDLDGTLIDSADVWARIDAEFLRRRGLAVPDDYMCAVSSKKFSEAAVYTIARFGLDETAEALAAEWLEMARREYGSGVFLRPHAGEYLRWLKARGVKLGTVTGLPHSLAEAALKNNGVYALFDAFTSADETPCGKEHPAVYLLAARRLGVTPADCAVFEDVPACLESARAAGMKVFAVRNAQNESLWGSMCRGAIPVADFCELMTNAARGSACSRRDEK
ncbi:HAD family phosphatase [Pyramidobacter sp. SM-530-WT-4B]|uniref:HAD family phosphatase n=1 Tax=Pyramidobacter porci TaxID=2605789 RepID=A0A6L5YBN2_9BACT|nr:HAD family phosphatase [Pyramidobacter porci]MST55599.1 HAD family phosphatase [Pyramidobacter porci]